MILLHIGLKSFLTDCLGEASRYQKEIEEAFLKIEESQTTATGSEPPRKKKKCTASKKNVNRSSDMVVKAARLQVDHFKKVILCKLIEWKA